MAEISAWFIRGAKLSVGNSKAILILGTSTVVVQHRLFKVHVGCNIHDQLLFTAQMITFENRVCGS